MTTHADSLRNPPIVEAILAFQLPHAVEVAPAVEQFYACVAAQFPDVHRKTGARFVFATGEQTPILSELTLTSADKLEVVRLSPSSFRYHRLKPYPGWETFSLRAEELWRRYVDIVQPREITETRLRFLNRIELPLPFDDIAEFFTTYPQVPPAIDTGMSRYLMRISFVDDSVKARAKVTQRLEYDEEDVRRGRIPLYFDIDVSTRHSFQADGEGAWGALESLRQYKNRIFFSSISDRTQALFR